MTSVLMSVLAMLGGTMRARAALHLEILALLHQLQVLQRSRPRRLARRRCSRPFRDPAARHWLSAHAGIRSGRAISSTCSSRFCLARVTRWRGATFVIRLPPGQRLRHGRRGRSIRRRRASDAAGACHIGRPGMFPGVMPTPDAFREEVVRRNLYRIALAHQSEI